MIGSIKNQFLVVECPFLYQFISGKPTLAEIIMVSSIVFLKMKYYIAGRLVTTLHREI